MIFERVELGCACRFLFYFRVCCRGAGRDRFRHRRYRDGSERRSGRRRECQRAPSGYRRELDATTIRSSWRNCEKRLSSWAKRRWASSEEATPTGRYSESLEIHMPWSARWEAHRADRARARRRIFRRLPSARRASRPSADPRHGTVGADESREFRFEVAFGQDS